MQEKDKQEQCGTTDDKDVSCLDENGAPKTREPAKFDKYGYVPKPLEKEKHKRKTCC